MVHLPKKHSHRSFFFVSLQKCNTRSKRASFYITMQQSTIYNSSDIPDMPSGAVCGSTGMMDSFFSNYMLIATRGYHTLYKARRYGRWYVLKGLNKELWDNVLYVEWLYKEYSVGIKLDHPNIVRVESLEDDAVAGKCIVMEYIEGVTLDNWLQAKPSLKERKRILDQLLDAVVHCHSRNIYHHDLKPSNILITNDNRLKLIDFGLSDGPQYAVFKQAAGSSGFAAPEQADGGTADGRADIYALGRLTEMIVPHHYKRAVHKTLRTNPDRRQQTVEAFWHDLRSRWWLGGGTSPCHSVIGILLDTPFAAHPQPATRQRADGLLPCP